MASWHASSSVLARVNLMSSPDNLNDLPVFACYVLAKVRSLRCLYCNSEISRYGCSWFRGIEITNTPFKCLAKHINLHAFEYPKKQVSTVSTKSTIYSQLSSFTIILYSHSKATPSSTAVSLSKSLRLHWTRKQFIGLLQQDYDNNILHKDLIEQDHSHVTYLQLRCPSASSA